MALSASAFADGMPGRGPRAPIEAPFSWTGFYGGGNLGIHWVESDRFVASPSNGVTATNFAACTANGTCPFNVSPGDGSGAIGGIQMGYNWQLQSFLLGIEADIQGSTAGASQQLERRFTAAGPGVPGLAGVDGTNHTAATVNVEWVGTIRARLGLLVSPTLLAYVTGGWAYAGVERTWGMSATNAATGAIGYATFAKTNNIESGWTVGGGLEWAVTNRVTVGGEYLFVGLGGGDAFGAGPNLQGTGCPVAAQNCLFGVRGGDTDNHIARLKVNYKF